MPPLTFDNLFPAEMLPRLASFETFADELGVSPDVLQLDDDCPSLVRVGGVLHADREQLARFRAELTIRTLWAEDAMTRAKAERRRIEAAETAAPAPEPAAA
jgi:hypothetical protein